MPPTLARFAISGLLAAIVYYLVAWVAVQQYGWLPASGGFVGYLAALPVAYGFHRLFTFRSSARILGESSRFVVSSVGGLALSSLLPTLLTAVGLPLVGALAATCVLVPIVNYLMLSRWTFADANHHG